MRSKRWSTGDRDKSTVVVAGGAGFIGSHLCDSLLSKGSRVICVDSLLTGSYDNIRPLGNHPRFQFVLHDIVEPLRLPGRIDRIYNLACPASPRHYQRDPIATMKTCVIGTSNLLDLAREKGARLLQASTSEVYGDPEIHPQTEQYRGAVNPIGPRACYDEGKRSAETICFDHQRIFGTQIKVARIFNTYGPRMLEDDGRVVSNFIVQALRGRCITVYGDGSQTRSFCFVSDLLHGLELLMESDESVAGPINLGNPQEITIERLAHCVTQLTNSRASIEHRPLPIDDPARRRPAIEKAMDLLGWAPQVDLKAGLQATIDYFVLHNQRQHASRPAPGPLVTAGSTQGGMTATKSPIKDATDVRG